VITDDDYCQFSVCTAFRQACYGQSKKETLNVRPLSDWPSPLTMISTQINNSLSVAKGQASVSREQTIVNKGKMFETHLHFPTLFFVAKSVQVQPATLQICLLQYERNSRPKIKILAIY